MFDNPFDFLPFILAIIALGIAVKAMNEITELRSRLNRMEIAALARSAPPPLPPMFEQGTAPTAPGIAAEPPPIAPDAEWAAPGFSKPAETAAETVADMAGSPPAAPPPPLPQPDPGFEETIGTKFNLVQGYPGGPEIDLAVERGEIHCRAFTIEAFMSREPYHTWRKKGFVRNIIQTGKKRDAKLPETPTLWELMDRYKTLEPSRRLATLMLASGQLGRPMMGTPGIPADRIKILRDAFNATMKDPEFLTDIDKRQFDLDPVPGEELEKIVKDVMSQPPDVIARMKKLLGN